MKNFYHYYPAKTGKDKILNEGTIKWSTPFEFNDPFDNQFELHLEEANDALIDRLNESFARNADKFLDYDSIKTRLPKEILKAALRKLNIGEEEKVFLRKGVIESIEILKTRFPDFKNNFIQNMRDISVFCLSEVNDDILMWSHYADKHTGIAVKFLPREDIDSAFQAAKPIVYSQFLPRLSYEDFLVPPDELDKQVKKLVNLFTLTKSTHWAYEKEWRVVSRLRDKSKLYEVLKFDPLELGAVYLGCNISNANEQEILQITRAKFPHAEIFKAHKSKTEFALEFEKIDN